MPQIPIYRQQTTVGASRQVDIARPQLSGDEAAAGMRLAQTGQGAVNTLMRMKEEEDAEKKREEEENARVWTMRAISNIALTQTRALADAQDKAEPGAPGFADNYLMAFDEATQEALSVAPNDTSKKFLSERVLALRSDMAMSASSYERQERARWRVSTVEESIGDIASIAAQDKARVPVMLAEQRAVIEAMDIGPEQKRSLNEALTKQVATSAVIGEIQRDPGTAVRQLSARLGVDVSQTTTLEISSDSVFERMIKQESRGRHFGKDGQPTTSPVGAIGIAQIMPETGPEAARYANLPWDPSRFRNDPEYNLALGRAYFDKQVKTFGHPMLAAAAYNAGPGAVQKWLSSIGDPTKGEVSFEEFASRIPYKETRDYVRIVSGGGKKIEQVTTGERVNDPVYDMLDVPQVVSLLGTANQAIEKQRAEMRSFVASREMDDLAAYGDGKLPERPLSSVEFMDAYGAVEGMQRWERYKSAQSFASEHSGLSTKTPEEIKQILEQRAPQAGEGYAYKAQQYETLKRAAITVLEARQKDPVQFSIQIGASQPLNMQDMGELGEGLKRRAGLAQTNTQKFGTPYRLLSNTEAQQMAAMLKGMTAAEKSQFLGEVSTNLTDPVAYQSVMGILRNDSPVTATAGSLAALRSVPEAQATSRKILAGEDILNPATGKPLSIKMPKDTDLLRVWSSYTGSAYAGSPKAADAAFKSYKAYVAAEIAEAGVDASTWNNDVQAIAERAVVGVTGGVLEVNDTQIVKPYGYPDEVVDRRLREAWTSQNPNLPFDAIGLRTIADGLYAVTAGTGPHILPPREGYGTVKIGGMTFDDLGNGALRSRDNGGMYIRIERGPDIYINGQLGGFNYSPIPQASPATPINDIP